MTDTFNSTSDAVAFALSCRRGPQAARPSLGKTPKGYRSGWDASQVRACMQRVGIEIDSHEERELEAWVFSGGPKPIKLERALRVELDNHGLLKREVAVVDMPVMARVTFTDADTGAEVTTMQEIRREGER